MGKFEKAFKGKMHYFKSVTPTEPRGFEVLCRRCGFRGICANLRELIYMTRFSDTWIFCDPTKRLDVQKKTV